MAASDVLSQLAHFLSFMREHPKLSFLVLLLLSPPIFRILLYFTPLLLSTALCIFALITLAPYVTATDAEVERQSLLGTSSYQRKSKCSPIEGEKDAGGAGDGTKSCSLLSSVSPSTTSLSGSAACPSVSASPTLAVENSWMSWMKGLNDIGRAWVESKLAEQGLALSEPANRETLLALIEGSFADLVTVKENYAEIFSSRVNDVDADHNETESNDMVSDLPMKDETKNEAKEPTVQLTRSVSGIEVECWAGNALDVHEADHLPESVTHDLVDESARAAESLSSADSGDVISTNQCASQWNEGNDVEETSSRPSNNIVPHAISNIVEGKSPISHEGALPVIDAIVDVAQTSTIMPRTPSRISAPSKLIEASRRIFSKEEQSKSMIPRAPFLFSGRVQPSKSSTGSTTQSKIESTVSAMKLPTRRFLERSKSIPGKEGCKLGNASSTEKLTHGKAEEERGVASQGKEKLQRNVGNWDANDSVNALGSSCSDFTDGDVSGEGPKFDEDLEVEEAQALVQSELKMLEVELEEVAAKLPKLEGVLAYQKTPVKAATSVGTSLSPTRAPLRSNIALFSAIPVAK